MADERFPRASQPPIVPGADARFNAFSFCQASSRSARNAVLSVSAAELHAITSTSSGGNPLRSERNDSRTTRLIRLRSTARLLTLRETASPSRAKPCGDSIQRSAKCLPCQRPVARCNARKSAARRSRAAGGKPAMHGALRDQALAALGAPRGQDLATVGGLHAGAKTVGAGALEHAGLVSAFHG